MVHRCCMPIIVYTFRARKVIACDNTVAIAVGAGLIWLFYVYHTFSTTHKAGQALVTVNACAVAENTFDGRFRDSHLSPAATDLAGGELGQELKRLGSLSLAEGALHGNLSFTLPDNFYTHYISLHYLITTARDESRLLSNIIS